MSFSLATGIVPNTYTMGTANVIPIQINNVDVDVTVNKYKLMPFLSDASLESEKE